MTPARHAALLTCLATLCLPGAAPAAPRVAPGDEPPASLTLDLADAPISTLLESLDEHTRLYNEHITTLANPFFEGRAPGLRGNALAAEYLAFHFKRLGLTPAFSSTTTASEGTQVLTARDSFYQDFSVGEDTYIDHATLQAGALGDLTLDQDFSPLAFSGSASVSAPLVFVGYAIENGRDAYSSFEDATDLTGKIALILRFEPMDEQGRSLWLPGGWSPNAGVEAKFRAVARRGAAGIILVNPPGADDERISRLESVNSMTPFGGSLDIPVIHLRHEVADRLVRLADPQGRSLLDLRRLADAGPAIIDLPAQQVSIDVALDARPTMTRNVGAILPGRGDLAEQIVVIGAHFDHVGYGYTGGSRGGASAMGLLHPGADDNASGTSGMLVAAQVLTDAYAALPEDAPARSILFLGFSGEELGLLGSAHYVRNPIVPIARHTFMLNMDMIGRLRQGVLELGGVRTAEGLWEWLEPKVAASGLDVRPLPGGVGPSDHTNFYNAGMPVLFFHTLLHDEYHMPTDFSWTINRVGAVQVVRLAVDVALDLATRPDRFERGRVTRPTTRPADAPRPYLGITADDAPAIGVAILSVGEDTPASRAGLLEGDIIIRWQDRDVSDRDQWRTMLQAMRPGDQVSIVVLRDNKEVMITCTLGER